MGGHFGREGRLRHSGLGIDFQNNEFARSFGPVVIPEVGPAYAATTERPVRLER